MTGDKSGLAVSFTLSLGKGGRGEGGGGFCSNKCMQDHSVHGIPVGLDL